MNRDQRGDPDLPPGPGRDLVDLFRRLRHRRPLTGGQLAIKTGLSPGHLSDVLRGWKVPSADAADKIVRALGGSQEQAMAASRLAGEQADLNRYQRRRDRAGTEVTWPSAPPPAEASAAAPRAARRPLVLSSGEISLYRVTGLAGREERLIGTVTGDMRRVRCAEVWVNSENTDMLMARFDEFSVSAIIRYEGASRDDVGRAIDDPIARELNAKVLGRRPVPPGTSIVTGPGELARYQVRYVVHVAAVQGEPGAGFRQVREVGRCVTSVLAEIDGIGAEPPLRSVLFPLLGVGQGGGDLPSTVGAMAGAAIDHFSSTPSTMITTVYFLAYTDVELEVCEEYFSASRRLRPVSH